MRKQDWFAVVCGVDDPCQWCPKMESVSIPILWSMNLQEHINRALKWSKVKLKTGGLLVLAYSLAAYVIWLLPTINMECGPRPFVRVVLIKTIGGLAQLLLQVAALIQCVPVAAGVALSYSRSGVRCIIFLLLWFLKLLVGSNSGEALSGDRRTRPSCVVKQQCRSSSIQGSTWDSPTSSM